MGLPTYYNELAQTFEEGIEVACLDWNNLFSGSTPLHCGFKETMNEIFNI